MSSIPPPPSGAESPPPPEDFSGIPPPSGEEHVNDVLERKKKFSWKNFGGDGFLVSVAFHILLAIIAIFYIVSRYQAPKKNTDPEVFATGAGGGKNGDAAKAFEHPKQTRMTNVKMPSRITTKGASAISLPETPQTNTASFASGLTSGGMSKGSGGGSGGGEGTGIGIGKGGGRNFVSLFGSRGIGLAGLPGNFYDGKQYADGRPSPYAEDKGNDGFIDNVLRKFVKSGWEEDVLQKYFHAPRTIDRRTDFHPKHGRRRRAEGLQRSGQGERQTLGRPLQGHGHRPHVGQIPFRRPRRRCARRSLEQKGGRRRRLDRPRLPGTPQQLQLQGAGNDAQRAAGITRDTYKGSLAPPFRCGTWIPVEKGKEYPMEVIISEVPGGRFAAYLLMEESDPDRPGKPKGGRILFRMSGDPLPDGIVENTGLSVDMTGGGMVWKARGDKNRLVR